MRVVVGHERVRAALGKADHRAMLFLGPDSVGKRTVALDYCSRFPCRIWEYNPLTSESAREIQGFVSRGSLDGSLRFVLITLDGASEQACNQLLKVLEEAPEYARFILLASQQPLATIASRCVVFRFGLLSDDQVAQVLESACGLDAETAARQAPSGGGRVRPAANPPDDAARARVAQVLRALSSGDQDGLAAALRDWDARSHQLLGAWACEAAVPRWRQFSPGFAPGSSPALGRRVFGALSVIPAARARLAAYAALAPLCAAEKLSHG